MARIWYSLVGIGMGHAIRSETVISHLRKRHEIIITASNRSYAYLKDVFPDVYEIKENILDYHKNRISISGTIKNYSLNLYRNGKDNTKILNNIIPKFKPDILISDFENYSMFYARKHGIPGIFLDNINMLTRCRVSFPEKQFILGFTKVLRGFLYPEADAYLICDFADAKPINPQNTRMISPIIRDSVLKLKPRVGDFGLVYQTTDTNIAMLPILKKQKRKFKIYGMGVPRKDGNLIFMDFDEMGFLKDLSNAAYVIINGGFTVMSEALYLKKPLLSIPIKTNIEQEYNAYSIEREGFGKYSVELTEEDLKDFEKSLSNYRKNIGKVPPWNNEEAFRIVEGIISRVKEGKPIAPV